MRVIAATNVDLQQAVAERRFREDLFFRLQVLPIRMPTLAERREDIAELAAHLLRRGLRAPRLPRLELSRGALRAIESGGVAGQRPPARSTHRGGGHPRRRRGRARRSSAPTSFPRRRRPASRRRPAITFQEATRRFQAQLLRRALEETEWNIVETARRLDLARSHVYNLIRAFGLTRGDR